MAAGGQIDDAEATMRKSEPCRLVSVGSLVVRTAMLKADGHALQLVVQSLLTEPARVDEPRESAHTQSVLL